MNPLTPPDCDLRNFPFMPLDVLRLRDSDLSALESAEAFRAAVLLWCASWHQVPAASLPNDDQVLSNLAGFGRVVKEWQKVKKGALRGWVQCDDGRLYHPVIAEKALNSLESKYKQEWRTEISRIKKHNQRHPDNKLTEPEFEAWLSTRTINNCLIGQYGNVSSLSQEKQHPTETETETETDITVITNSVCNTTVPSVSAASPTLKGEICKALTQLRLPPFNPQNPKLDLAIEAGATVDEFTQTAIEIRQKDQSKFNFDYLLAVVIKRRQDAKAMPAMQKGALKPVENVAAKSIFKSQAPTEIEVYDAKQITA